MRICLLTHSFPRFSGDTAAPFMDGLARGIVSAGNEVFVLTPFSPRFGTWRKNLSYRLITYRYIFPDFLHKLGYSETLTDDKELKLRSFLLAPFLYFGGVIALYRLVKKEKIDLINAHWILPNGFIAAAVSILTSVPVVSTLPGSDVYMAQRNFFFRLLARFAAKVSKGITSNSPQLLADLEELTGEKVLEKSQAIIYGVDPLKFRIDRKMDKKLRASLKIGEKEKIVLGVGRLVSKKGFEYFVKAAPSVLRKYKDTTFVIVGNGDQKDYLINLSKKLRVYSKFRFVGSVDYENLIYYYNLADVFVLPSIRDEEGNLDDQSVSVVEAMACGKPVITTNFPGYREVVEDGKSGFLVRQKAIGEIVEKLDILISSLNLRFQMGSTARRKVVAEFSWESIARKYSNLFASHI